MFWTVAALLAVNLAVLAASWFLLRGWLEGRLAAPRQAADLDEEVGRLVTELNQAAERTVVLLEDRTAALNDLLAAADKKIGLLRREIERHEAGDRVYGHLAGPRARAAAAAAAQDSGHTAEAVPSAPVSLPAAPAAPTAPAAAAPAGGPGAGQPVTDARTELRAQIGRLARGGLPAAAIAARTGAPLGEVELILSIERLSRGS
jgi:hypothetical protein